MTCDASNPVSSRPRVVADHLESRLQRRRIDPDAFDRAGRRPLTAADLSAFERRAGRARRGQQSIAVAQYDLGVGPDIDDQVHGLLVVGRLGQDHACGVRTHMTRDAGQQVYTRAGVHVEIELRGPPVHGAVRGQGERRAAKFGRVQAQEEMVHDRVPDHGERQDVRRVGAGVRAKLRGQLVHARPDHARQLALRAWVHHQVGHTAHQILAEPDLRVHGAGRRQDLPARQVAQVSRHGGRPHVEGHTEHAVVEPRPNTHDRRTVVHGDRRRPVAGAKGSL